MSGASSPLPPAELRQQAIAAELRRLLPGAYPNTEAGGHQAMEDAAAFMDLSFGPAEPERFGWLFDAPGTGIEWSETKPARGENVRPATAKALHAALTEAWRMISAYHRREAALLAEAEAVPARIAAAKMPEPWELEPAAIFLEHVEDDETGSAQRVAAFLRSLIPTPPAGGADDAG